MKNTKLEMLENSISRKLQENFQNPSGSKKTSDILDLLEGIQKSEITDDTKQLIRDIKSKQMLHEALLEKADHFLKKIEIVKDNKNTDIT